MGTLKNLNRLTIFLYFIFSSFGIAQVGINTNNPNKDSDLELASPDKALLLNRVADPGSIEGVDGMIIFDTTAGCLKIFYSNGWHCLAVVENTDQGSNPDPDLPHLLPEHLTKVYLTTSTGSDPTDKENYISGTITIDSQGGYTDYSNLSMGVRGRGNYSWNYFPKKGWKVKLGSKQPLFGMTSAKDWALIPDYFDGTMLDFSIPYEMARMLDMPFTNEFIPVELYINGNLRGIYGFTSHKEVKAGRIDLEESGVLLEMDYHYDEPNNQFRSSPYNIPTIIKYPEDDALTTQRKNEIQTEFNQLATLVNRWDFPNNGYRDLLDEDQFINYMLVMTLTLNHEINNPGSVYLHKVNAEGKYRMGIVWDFDWAFGFNYSSSWPPSHYNLNSATKPIFTSWDGVTAGHEGYFFFSKIMSDPYMQSLFSQRWEWFKQSKFQKLKNFITEYARVVRQGFDADHNRWYYESNGYYGQSYLRGSSGDMDTDLQKVMDWLDARANYIDSWISGGFQH